MNNDDGEETRDKKNPLTFTFSLHEVFWLFHRIIFENKYDNRYKII